MQTEIVNQLVPFQFESMTVRALVGDDGEPLFVARDVAVALGYADTDQAVRAHCKAASTYPVEITGQVRNVKVIPERDVYRLIMRSKLSAADRFEEWVVGEVLPSIRKTGSYHAAPAIDLNDPAFLRTMLLGYTEQVLALQATVAEQAPKAEFHDKYAVSTGNKGFREVCKLLKANEREFREFLIAEDVMYRLGGKMMPKAPHLVTGRFEVKAGIDEETGHAFNQAKFTPKGITWVAGEWAKHGIRQIDAAIEQHGA